MDLLECVSLYLDFDCHACDCVRGGVVYPIFDHCPGGGVRTCCDCVRGGVLPQIYYAGVWTAHDCVRGGTSSNLITVQGGGPAHDCVRGVLPQI